MSALATFLREWLDWAEAGGKDHHDFSREYGLCSNVNSDEAGYELCEALEADFNDASHPFGVENYHDRQIAGTQHASPLEHVACVDHWAADIAPLHPGGKPGAWCNGDEHGNFDGFRQYRHTKGMW